MADNDCGTVSQLPPKVQLLAAAAAAQMRLILELELAQWPWPSIKALLNYSASVESFVSKPMWVESIGEHHRP